IMTTMRPVAPLLRRSDPSDRLRVLSQSRSLDCILGGRSTSRRSRVRRDPANAGRKRTRMTASTRGRWLGVALATGMGLCSFALATEAEAAPTPGNKIRGRGGNFGIGLSLGDPMGASMKYFMAANHAIQGDIGWAPLHHGHGRLGFDYLWHPGTFVSNSTIDLVPYLGLGI